VILLGIDLNNFRNDWRIKTQNSEGTPNKQTIDAIIETRNQEPTRKSFKSTEELMQDLESDL
jgi:hypothetical protein